MISKKNQKKSVKLAYVYKNIKMNKGKTPFVCIRYKITLKKTISEMVGQAFLALIYILYN